MLRVVAIFSADSLKQSLSTQTEVHAVCQIAHEQLGIVACISIASLRSTEVALNGMGKIYAALATKMPITANRQVDVRSDDKICAHFISFSAKAALLKPKAGTQHLGMMYS
jgi:hypothetical protein